MNAPTRRDRLTWERIALALAAAGVVAWVIGYLVGLAVRVVLGA
jgi:hypothetical protein